MIRRAARAVPAALLALLLALPAAAGTLRRELGPADPLAELVLRGENRAAEARRIVLRVDDRAAPPYADRANVERLVPPGPFVLRWRLALLETPRGRVLDLAALRQAIAFAPEGDVALATLAPERPPALPEGVRGWSFAPPGAAPLAEMEAVAPGDPRLSGPGPRFVRRNGEDPILARGMAGVTRFVAPLPEGRWRIALWTEDPGAWETLPPLLEHRIRANGRDIHAIRRDEAGWIAQRYLAGREIEPDAGSLPFQAIGASRGGRIEAVVEIGAEGLVLELAGHPRAATHIAALLAEPAEAPPRAVAALEGLRTARFAEAWPVLSRPRPARAEALRLDAPAEAIAAPGGLAVLRFTALAPAPGPARAALAWEGDALPARLLWAQWRWRRPAPETPGLALEPVQWRADLAALRMPADLPRHLAVLVRVPEDAAPGARRLRLTLEAGSGAVTAEAALHVLPVTRPAPSARVGVFLDVAPHLAAFPAFREAMREQARCDLEALAALGLTAVAPPLATPDEAGRAEFLADLRQAAARFAPPFPAYAPLRRLARAQGPDTAAALAARAMAAATAEGLPPVAWVIADEPSGAGTMEAARRLAAAMRNAAPGAPLAAHLNDPRDAALLPLLDLATVNHRFGADAADIARLRAGGVVPWLYNLPRLRLGAGFHLWRSGAAGLLQWHARMPTADPFDPTDGREGDVQFLWPTPAICDPPDLDADLLALAEGAEDLRWLAWLEAQPGPQAAALLARLRRQVPERWADAAALPPAAEAAWRAEIAALARRLAAPQSRPPP